jgi:hypothetical protein
MWPAWDVFITSPGAGGAAALAAAVVVGGSALWVSKHRQSAERNSLHELQAARLSNEAAADASRKASENHLAQARWWDRFVWLVGNSTMSLEAQIEVLEQMTREAELLNAPGLIKVAKTWAEDLYRHL